MDGFIDLKKIIPERIRYRRILMGLKSEDVAKRIGTSYQNYHNYEHGKTRIPADKLFLLSRIFNVNMEYFFQDLTVCFREDKLYESKKLMKYFSLLSQENKEILINIAYNLSKAN